LAPCAGYRRFPFGRKDAIAGTGGENVRQVETERRVDRRRRATALIALAAISIAGASIAFLYSAQPSKPPFAASDNPLLVTRDFVTYSFTSPTEGWAMDMASGTAFTASRLTIFRTVDRGRRWEKQLSLSDAFFGYGALPLQAVDSSHCFMLLRGPKEELLFRTSDRGAHWDQLAVPDPNVDVVAFADKDYGWLLTSGTDLYVTHDAGSSWKPLPAPPQDATQISVRGSSAAWMNGVDTGPPHVYSSTDGGQSWQRHDLPSPPGASWGPDSYFQSSLEFLPQAGVVAHVMPDGGTASFTFTSFDGGRTWRYVRPPSATVAYEDSSVWWAMGGSGFFKSSDAGQTWFEVATLPDWMYRPQLSIVDSKHAWASVSVPASLSSLGGNGLAFTDDGGLHWTRTQVPHET
jgi:photosystem II stability/assembly factor-like uncharacterized protein